ncbi:MAG: DUF2589 domain-containing protein [Bacteroidales bacterium]|jgi:hypothetical protein|nr:DUF2589 domain-containing protein [Bacteroidales bacterium]MCR5554925.1 DUF2589 domain-containing protein [Bacteroidales bacterium]
MPNTKTKTNKSEQTDASKTVQNEADKKPQEGADIVVTDDIDKTDQDKTENKGQEDKSETEFTKTLQAVKQGVSLMKDILETEKNNGISSMMTELSKVTADTNVGDAALNSLTSLPFDKIIGGPLQAAIAAQSSAAKSTLEFITQAGIKADKAISISFEFCDSNGNLKKMIIPLLTMVPIPTMAIKEMQYEFKAKIETGSSANASMSSGITGTWNFGYAMNDSTTTTIEGIQEKQKEAAKTGEKPDENKNKNAAAATPQKSTIVTTPKGLNFNASISTKKDSSASRDSKYNVEATMDIKVIAGQDDLPGGIQTLLNELNKAYSIVDPYGELKVAPANVVLSGGLATITATYRNCDGVFAPSDISCEDESVVKNIVDSSTVQFTFKKAGVYTIAAGACAEVVVVNEEPEKK